VAEGLSGAHHVERAGIAGGGDMEMLQILIPIAVAHAVVLGAIVFGIHRLLQIDTLKAVARIQQVEAEVRKKEEGIRREIEEHEKEFARKKAEAEDALQKQKEASEKEVGVLRDQVLGEARKESERILSTAKRNEEKLRQQVLQEMEGKAVDYGTQVFKLVFSEKVTESLNKQFIDELLDALQEVDGSSITVDTSDVQFTTSQPMDPEQKGRLEKLLQEKFNVQIKVEEKINKDLMAGIIFKLGSLEIDGSLLNRFHEAAAEVKKSTGG